jgi:hypothetical protein
MSRQMDDLNFMLLTGRVDRLTDEPPMPDTTPVDPVGQWLEKSANAAAGVPENYDSTQVTLSKTLEARMIANRVGLGIPYGSALGLTKRAEVTLERDPGWDETLGSGSDALHKRAPESGERRTIFAKGTLGAKLGICRTEEKTDADGDKWIYGYNAADELVDARVIDSI